MNALRSYFDATGEKQSALADRCNTSGATISRLAAGTMTPSLALAHAIERETKGAVPTETWVDAADADDASPSQ